MREDEIVKSPKKSENEDIQEQIAQPQQEDKNSQGIKSFNLTIYKITK